MTPVVMPAIEVGSTTLRIVSHFGTPSAYAASRSSFGHELQHLLARAHDDRDHQHRQRDGAAEAQRTPGPKKSANSA